MASKSKKESSQGLEASLWDAANKLRSNMDAAEYKHVVLGLIFLKYVSDVFQKRRTELEKLTQTPDSDYYMPNESARNSILESRDEYTSEGVFWVPEGHRWDDLRKAAKQADIGSRIDAAMDAIEKENNSLKGVLPKNYARRELTPAALGGLIDTFSREDLTAAEHDGLDVLGRVFEYMVAQFASAEGKLGGEFYTPRSVVQLLVEMLEPFNGRVYDPACGSGGMFVQADKFVKAHGGVRNDISVFGQEMNPTTWRLAKMNLALRGIDANLGAQWGDSFANDQHPDLRADFVIANPPFNISDWGGENLRDDPRWKYGVPPTGNANYAWIQHMLHHLTPTGTMATVLANGSLSTKTSGEGEIRKNLVDVDLVECIVSLPDKLFYTTVIPVSLWFLTKDKSDFTAKSERSQRDRKGEVLFIDARNLGTMVTRTVRELSNIDIATIAKTFNAWRGRSELDEYMDVPGFCASVSLEEIRENDYILTPGRYVGLEEIELDGEPTTEKLNQITGAIKAGFEKRATLQGQVLSALEALRANTDE
jgi:type I restriction enzyme M protein